MMRGPGLNRQITLAMLVVSLGMTLVVLLSSYVFYALVIEYRPDLLSGPTDMIPTSTEWIWMASVTMVALVFAIWASARLARRILAPLNSVADSVRRVAHGDLAARAVAGDRSLGETALLVDDFNAMAERLQRMEREMVTWNAAIAHELRTPVTILRGRLQGLAEGVFEPDEKQFRGLLHQVEGLSRLIDDLRMLSMFDSGHLKLELADCDLAGAMRDVAHLLAPQMEAAGYTLALDLAEGRICCDGARMRQILLALLDNAGRYADPGVIHIRTRVLGAQYLLQVEDAGPGIDEDLEGKLFLAFHRGEHARAGAVGGSGLGLAVVRAIAEAHGGVASYRRGDGGGAMFEIAWPMPMPGPAVS